MKFTHLCALLVLAACESSWTTLKPADSGFVLEMPGDPKCDSWGKETASNQWVVHDCTFKVEPHFIPPVPPVAYAVRWYDIPPNLVGRDITEVLREFGKPALPSPSPLIAKIQREMPAFHAKYRVDKTTRRALLGGVDALQSDSVPSSSQPEFVSRERQCIHGRRLYWLYMSGATSEARERNWERMVESFRFVEG